MNDRLWLVLLNSAAGFGAAAGWAWFAYVRASERRWGLMILDLVMTGACSAVGLAFGLVAAQTPFGFVLLRRLAWLALPILIIPVVVHLIAWMKGQAFVSDVESGGNE